MAVAYLPLLLQPGPVAMAVLLVLSGLGLPVLLTVTFLTVDRVAPAGTAAEAFAWVATAFAIGSAAGAALTGLLIDAADSVRAGFTVSPVLLGPGGRRVSRSRPGADRPGRLASQALSGGRGSRRAGR